MLIDGATPISVNETIDGLRKRFKPEAARDLNLTYLIRVTGEGGGTWLVKIANQQCEFIPYDANNPTTGALTPECTISVDAADLELIITGRLSAMTAALSGVLSIDGELGQAMQLIPIFFESGF